MLFYHRLLTSKHFKELLAFFQTIYFIEAKCYPFNTLKGLRWVRHNARFKYTILVLVVAGVRSERGQPMRKFIITPRSGKCHRGVSRGGDEIPEQRNINELFLEHPSRTSHSKSFRKAQTKNGPSFCVSPDSLQKYYCP